MKLIRSIIKNILFFLLAVFTVFYGIQFYIDLMAQRFLIQAETAPQVQAVLVLGAGVYANGTPSPVLQDRLDHALVLYEKKVSKKIIVSGDHGTKEYDEVNAMKNYLLKKGVPREDIFMDHAGFDTYDSIIRARDIFGVESLIISTQEFHINRAVYIGRRLGIETFGYAAPDKEIYGMAALEKREQLAKIKAFIDVEILKRNPKYQGEGIPVTGDGIATEG